MAVDWGGDKSLVLQQSNDSTSKLLSNSNKSKEHNLSIWHHSRNAMQASEIPDMLLCIFMSPEFFQKASSVRADFPPQFCTP
jgi:hypothetical protein